MRFPDSFRLLISLLVCFISLSALAQHVPDPGTFIDPHDTLRQQVDEERRRLVDPQTGVIPYERLDQARQQILNGKSQQNASATQSGIPGITWQERGPNNFADVRSVLVDPNDAAKKKVWVGTASGGVWYTNDITNSTPVWSPVSENWESQLVTALAADPSNAQIMYAGTGELSYTTGRGIWKTTNGGTTWTRLSSTIPSGSYPSIGRGFEYIQRIVVNGSGQVFVASRYGVLKSADGGVSWQNVLAPNQGIGFGTSTGNYGNDAVYDLEVASDGVVFVSFAPGRVFKSTNAAATSWAEITPVGVTGDRTEIAVAQSTSGSGQVLYAVSRFYNNTVYSQDIKWFKKSTDAGITWTDVVIPLIGSDHFTRGNGYRYMSLTAHPTNANIIFAGGLGLFRSVNGGATWTAITEASTANPLTYQIALQVVPGTDGMVNAALQGIYWLADAASDAVASPTAVARTNGLRTGAVYSIAMKNSPGSNYFLANVQPTGVVTMNSPGIGKINSSIWGTSSTNNVHIDTNESNIQVFMGATAVNVFDGASYQTIYSTNYVAPIPSDYDSQSNTLYIYEYSTTAPVIRRTAGIGSGTLTTTVISLTAIGDQLTYLKLSADQATLFAGGYNGKLYKITGLNQPTPTFTRIDNGAFGQVAFSSIDVGATDNELLVTFSNYGSQSVWYTADGGALWMAKDQLNYGLPDIPVWTGMFNPQNRQQVLLGTDLGLWTTSNITAPNPGWTVSDGGLPLLRVNQLRYRAADGKVAATTVGRGIWTTDAFAIPYTLPTVTLTGIDNKTLCAGSTMTVSFSTSGTFDLSNRFEVWISDASGSFSSQRRIGTGTSNPIAVTLPSSIDVLPYGTNYLVKVVALSPEVESAVSEPLAIGNLSNAYTLNRLGYTGNTQVCVGGSATLSFQGSTNSGFTTAIDRYQWTRDGVPISGATSQSYVVTQSGVYSGSLVQAGCKQAATTHFFNVSNSIFPQLSYPSAETPQCTGQTITLTASYPGDNATYQWYKNDVLIDGVTGSTFPATQSGRYSVQVKDANCSASTSSVTYEFGTAIGATIRFDRAADTLICANYANYYSSAYMYIENNSKFSALQWYKNGTLISGATNGYYYASEPGTYHVVARQGNCQTTTNTLIRKATSQLPVTITYNGATSLCIGDSRYLRTQAMSNVSYQWQKDGVDIAGETSSVYSVSAGGVYTVRVSAGGNACSGSSDSRLFSFGNTIVPKIVADRTSVTSCGNLYISTYERANDYSNEPVGFSYQWQRDGVDIAGQTLSSTYANSTGLYRLRMTKGTCSGVSKTEYYSHPSPPKPVIDYAPSQKCINNAVKLTASSGSYGTTIWKRDGIVVSTTSRNEYSATQTGRYTFSYTNSNCTSPESDPVDVKIGEPTAATIAGDAVIGAGQTTYLPIVFSGPAPWSVTLSNGQSATGVTQNPYLMPVAPGATTTYTIGKVANACATGTSSGSAVVTVGSGSADVSLDMIVSSRTPRVGQMVSYSLILTNAGPEVANGVQVQSMLPQGVSFLSSESPAITSGSGVVNVAVGALPVGIPTTFVFQTIISIPGVMLTNAQIIGSQTPDPDSQPNSGIGAGQDDEAQVDLRTTEEGPIMTSANPNPAVLPRVISNQPAASSSSVELSLQMNLNKLLVSVAQQEVVTATLTVRNRSAITATGVVVRVQLPNGAAQVTPGWQVVDTQTIDGFLSSIPAGGSATLQLFWRPSADGDLKAQVFDVAEPATGFIPGNGYSQGEKDEAQARVRSK
ncbi:hypothetical protein [Fibrella arboris]|uniref:hypothetical protein n=1 Tax=Fibrella arboris TaxID=3242486 RepID=UPI003520148A